jgi:FkbM family methyltransferase
MVGVFTPEIMNLLKRTALRMFPAGLTFLLKKYHYGRTIPSFWEPDAQPLKYLLRSGDLVIDIGAHVGWYTYILSFLVGENGSVYAIEPIPESFDLLAAVIERLQLRNVQRMNCAISSEDGSALMEVPLHESGVENSYQARVVDNSRTCLPLKRCEVRLRSLDSMLSNLSKDPTFIKCDVEGHELSVVKGASQTIWKCRPSWLIEVTGDPDEKGSSADKLFRLLSREDYQGYWFDGESLRARSVGDKAINYFFLQPSHVAQVECGGMSVKH